MPVSKPAWKILHGRLHAGLDHFKGARLIGDTAEEACGKASRAKLGFRNDGAKIIEIRFDSIEPRLYLLARMIMDVSQGKNP